MAHPTEHRGFSLIELLIVVGVIMVIAAIAIPSLLRARISANEGSAVQSLRTINVAAAGYAASYGTGYPAKLADLQPPNSGKGITNTNAGLIDSVLASGTKSGYKFTYKAAAAVNGTVHTYTIKVKPSTKNVTGTRYFFTDQTAVIRWDPKKAATASSPPIQ
jgi:prepilin-type N-terminal cleavage/methylation domain-containing protein